MNAEIPAGFEPSARTGGGSLSLAIVQNHHHDRRDDENGYVVAQYLLAPRRWRGQRQWFAARQRTYPVPPD
jgi:hypothetical protein